MGVEGADKSAGDGISVGDGHTAGVGGAGGGVSPFVAVGGRGMNLRQKGQFNRRGRGDFSFLSLSAFSAVNQFVTIHAIEKTPKVLAPKMATSREKLWGLLTT
jgi:hypothetical protein